MGNLGVFAYLPKVCYFVAKSTQSMMFHNVSQQAGHVITKPSMLRTFSKIPFKIRFQTLHRHMSTCRTLMMVLLIAK